MMMDCRVVYVRRFAADDAIGPGPGNAAQNRLVTEVSTGCVLRQRDTLLSLLCSLLYLELFRTFHPIFSNLTLDR